MAKQVLEMLQGRNPTPSKRYIFRWLLLIIGPFQQGSTQIMLSISKSTKKERKIPFRIHLLLLPDPSKSFQVRFAHWLEQLWDATCSELSCPLPLLRPLPDKVSR